MKGRTYRYMSQEPLFPFGYGLSYSRFKYGLARLDRESIKTGEIISVSVPIRNTSRIDGDEVVQVYLRKEDDTDGPLKTLRAFSRINIPAGETSIVNLTLTADQLEWWNATTGRMEVQPGNYEIQVGSSSQASDLQNLWVTIR